MSEEFVPPPRSWPAKFRDACGAMLFAFRGQASFRVHFVCAGLVLAAALVLRVALWEACLLALCVALVFAAELFNTALETLAKAIDSSFNPHLQRGLNLASAGVFMTAIGAAAVGAAIFTNRLAALCAGWRWD